MTTTTGGVGVVVAGGFGVAALGIVTPLSQTNFLPDLMQVNFLVPTICVVFNLVQVAPAFAGAAFAGSGASRAKISVRTDTEIVAFLMAKYWHYRGTRSI